MATLLRPPGVALVFACLWSLPGLGQAVAPMPPDVTAFSVVCGCDTTPRQLLLPQGYVSTKPEWYGEGSVQAFRYADRSVITLLCGSNAQLSLPKRQKKGCYSRKEVLPGSCAQLMYSNVPAARVALFNHMLDAARTR